MTGLPQRLAASTPAGAEVKDYSMTEHTMQMLARKLSSSALSKYVRVMIV